MSEPKPNESETHGGSCADEADAEAEQVAWEWFAGAHPHEAHAQWPDRFWTFFQSRCPGVTREQMARTLMETDDSPIGALCDGDEPPQMLNSKQS